MTIDNRDKKLHPDFNQGEFASLRGKIEAEIAQTNDFSLKNELLALAQKVEHARSNEDLEKFSDEFDKFHKKTKSDLAELKAAAKKEKSKRQTGFADNQDYQELANRGKQVAENRLKQDLSGAQEWYKGMPIFGNLISGLMDKADKA